jgi:hypothetical protein
MFRDPIASFAAALTALVGVCSLAASFTVAAAIASAAV